MSLYVNVTCPKCGEYVEGFDIGPDHWDEDSMPCWNCGTRLTVGVSLCVRAEGGQQP